MHMLVILLFMTAAYQHNIARASGSCGPPPQPDNTVPFHGSYSVNGSIRINCAEGYVRKAGTSSLFRCKEKDGKMSWEYNLPLQCIPDPKNPHVPKRTPMPFTPSTTERTDLKSTTVLGTSMPTTATGHITLTTINEVVTTKTRRTTSQSTLKSTTKEAESITTTNEITSSTSSSFASRDYMTATSSHTPPSSFTTITGVNLCMTTSTDSEGQVKVTSSGMTDTFTQTSTVGGVTSIIIICLAAAAAAFLFWWKWRLRRRLTNTIPLYDTNQADCTSYIPVPVYASEHCSAESNIAANKPTTDSVNDTNQPHTGSAHDANTCENLLPQTPVKDFALSSP